MLPECAVLRVECCVAEWRGEGLQYVAVCCSVLLWYLDQCRERWGGGIFVN